MDSLKLNAPGNTPTMALLSGSPAIGAADTNTSLSTDERGVQRKAVPDIGAYEAVPHADLNLTMKVSPDTQKLATRLPTRSRSAILDLITRAA